MMQFDLECRTKRVLPPSSTITVHGKAAVILSTQCHPRGHMTYSGVWDLRFHLTGMMQNVSNPRLSNDPGALTASTEAEVSYLRSHPLNPLWHVACIFCWPA